MDAALSFDLESHAKSQTCLSSTKQKTFRISVVLRNRWPPLPMTPPGRFLLHYSNPEDWRLRNAREHPVDPGWEDGEYSHCHPTIRPLIEVGTWILDVVTRLNTDRRREAVLRSVFQIETTNHEAVLGFGEFYFADSEPVVLPGHFIQYRMQTIPEGNLKAFLERVQSIYTLYKKGERPSSISLDNWELMKAIRRNALGP